MADILKAIDEEIAALREARALITGPGHSNGVKRGPDRPKGSGTAAKKKHNITPEGRARLVAAVKARWAKAKKGMK